MRRFGNISGGLVTEVGGVFLQHGDEAGEGEDSGRLWCRC